MAREPFPTRWTDDRKAYPKTVGRLQNLWAITTNDIQRYHLELIMDDVRADSNSSLATSVDTAVDDIGHMLDDVASQLRQLQRAVEKRPG